MGGRTSRRGPGCMSFRGGVEEASLPSGSSINERCISSQADPGWEIRGTGAGYGDPIGFRMGEFYLFPTDPPRRVWIAMSRCEYCSEARRGNGDLPVRLDDTRCDPRRRAISACDQRLRPCRASARRTNGGQTDCATPIGHAAAGRLDRHQLDSCRGVGSSAALVPTSPWGSGWPASRAAPELF